MEKAIVIEELNALLRGTYMGIRSFEHYIQTVDDQNLKKQFQDMQKEVKHNATKLAERIQNLGGVPADSEGVSGAMHSYMHKVMLPDDKQAMIEDAIKGLENYGVQYSEELVRGDLDPESRKVAEEVIDSSRKQVKQLKEYLH
jgi:bacterioferritin